MSTERCTVQLEGGIVEELLVDDGEAAEVMAGQERTVRARWKSGSAEPAEVQQFALALREAAGQRECSG